MVTRVLACAALVAATYFIAENASAQGRSTSGMSGMGGMGSSGMGGFGSSGFGSSGFGSGGMGSGGLGSGGFGSGGMGSGGFGSSGFGNSGSGRSGFGNSGFGNSGFGGGQSGGQNFVGRDATDMQGTFGGASRAQTQFFNNMNRQMSRNNRSRNTKKTTANASQQLRLQLKVGFNTPSAASNPVLAEQIRTRISSIAAANKMSQPLLTMQGDTAVISGTATSDSERMVIGQLVAMEPGVRDVQNLMTVPGEPTDIAQPPGG